MGILVVGDVLTDTIVMRDNALVIGGDSAVRITDSPGGQGANVAAWLVRAGVQNVQLFAAVSPQTEDSHSQYLSSIGVRPLLVPINGPSARIVVLVEPNGTDRSFLTQRGASALLDQQHADLVDLQDIAWCHVSGYLLSSPQGRRCYANLVTRCKAKKIPISFDPASITEIALHDTATLQRTLGTVDVLVPNEAEALLLSGAASPAEAARLLSRWATDVIVKCGPAGVVASGETVGAVRFPAIPAPLVDPTGAGDAFIAGFLAHYVTSPERDGAAFQAALENGLITASTAIGKVGAT